MTFKGPFQPKLFNDSMIFFSPSGNSTWQQGEMHTYSYEQVTENVYCTI